MAAENIDNTVNGTGLFNAKIPGLGDAADIQAALRLYHYGSYTYDGANTNVANLPNPSIAKYLQNLIDADATEIVNRNAAISAHNAATTNVHGILNTSLLATKEYVDSGIDNSTVDQSTLAGVGIDWNSGTSQFDLETQISNASVIIEKNNSFTLELSDVSKTILLSTSSPMSLTVPLNSSVAIPIGYQYHFIEFGSARTTFVPESGVTINSKNSQLFLDGRYSKGTLIKVATDSWVLYGDVYEGVTVLTTTTTAPTTTAAPTTTVAPTTTAPTTTVAPATTTPIPPFFPYFTPAPTATTPEPTTSTTTTTPVPTGTTPTTTTTTTTPAPTGTTPAPLPTISSFSAQCTNPDVGGCTDTLTQQAIWTIFNYSNASSYQITASPSTANGSTFTSNANADTDAYLGMGNKGTTYTLTLTVYASDNQQGASASSTITYTVPSGATTTTTTVAPTGTTPTTTTSTTTTTAAPGLTTYYGCCSSGEGVEGQYANSSDAATGLQQYCALEAGSNLVGGVYTTPQSCNQPTTTAAPTTTTTTPAPTGTTTTTTTVAPEVSRYRASFCGDGAPQQWTSNISCADAFTQASGNFTTITNWSCAFGTSYPAEPMCDIPPATTTTAPTTTASPTTTATTTAAPTTSTTTTAAPTAAPTTTTTAAPSVARSSFCTEGMCMTYVGQSTCGANQSFVLANYDNVSNYTCVVGTSTPACPSCTTTAPPFFPYFVPATTTAAPTAAPTTTAAPTAAPTTTAAPTAAPTTTLAPTAAPTTAAPTAAPTTTTTAAPATTAAPTSAPTTTTTAAPATNGTQCTSFGVSIGCCASTGCDLGGCGSGAACTGTVNRCSQNSGETC